MGVYYAICEQMGSGVGVLLPCGVDLKNIQYQAAAYWYGFIGGLDAVASVIEWADNLILELENPPHQLLELSLSGSRSELFIETLKELAGPEWNRQPLAPETLWLLGESLRQHFYLYPHKIARLTQFLERLSIEELLPEDQRDQVYSLDDSRLLAEDGIFDMEEVVKSVRVAVETFGKV